MSAKTTDRAYRALPRRGKIQLYLVSAFAVLLALSAAGQDSDTFPEPKIVHIEDDKSIQINVEFGIYNVLFPGQKEKTPIWTRSYQYAGKLCTQDAQQAYQGEGCAAGLIPPLSRTPRDDLDDHVKEFEVKIPGPSLYFKPGNFLQITLNNLLNDDNHNSMLHIYESNIDLTFDTDEIAHHVRHEVNLPHNPNNTNLHVHGLHVDPTQDNVTLVIIPEGESKMDYAPSLWPYIREQVWPYQYRIPKDHLPGTHWYHAHKHGSTSIHVENGMAGRPGHSAERPGERHRTGSFRQQRSGDDSAGDCQLRHSAGRCQGQSRAHG